MRRLARWLAVDAALFTVIIIAASIRVDDLRRSVRAAMNVPPRLSTLIVVVATAILSAPFGLGMIRMARVLGFELAIRAFPNARIDKADFADAPRRMLIVTLQMAIIVLVGLPVLAITQPFLPRSKRLGVSCSVGPVGAAILAQGPTNFQGHTRACAQAIAEALRKRRTAPRPRPADNHDAKGIRFWSDLPRPSRCSCTLKSGDRTEHWPRTTSRRDRRDRAGDSAG